MRGTARHGETAAAPAIAGQILATLRARLGEERFQLWFGGATISVTPLSEGPERFPCRVTIQCGFAADWLRRTFGKEMTAAVVSVCGSGSSVDWIEPEIQPAAVGQPSSSPPCRAQSIRKRTPGPRPRGAENPHAPQAVGAVPAGTAPGRGSTRQPATLTDFVVGTSNRMAVAAVELALSRCGEISPLLIHGPSGVGKTHLLEAICVRAREVRPGSTALLLSAEQFTTGFLQALHGTGLPGFRRTCRSAELLVIDDLPFFIGKRATIVELQNTVEELLRQGRQVVLSSDRDLDALEGLGTEFVARLRGGMHVPIDPPDREVRRGILRGLAGRRKLELPQDVVDYVADHLTRHARELIGAMNRLEATSHMLGLPITLSMAEEALMDLVRASSRSLRLADIERAVCDTFGIDAGQLQSSRRSRSVNHPRMLAMYLARRHTAAALMEIGHYFGRRSHSTVIAADRAVQDWLARQTKIVLADATWTADEAIRRVETALRVG